MKKIRKIPVFYIALSLVVFIFVFFLFINYKFQFSRVDIEVSGLDSSLQNRTITDESKKIVQITEQQIRQNARTLLDFVFLDSSFITKLVRDEYQTVNRIEIGRKFYYNDWRDFGFYLNVFVILNQEYFIGCISSEFADDFLLRSMLGNIDGEFYKEVPESSCQSEKLVFLLHPKSLYYRDKQVHAKDTDSLSGLRVYRKDGFQVLVGFLEYLEKNGFAIRKVFVNELGLVDIGTDSYVLKISLEKPLEKTKQDFETISKVGKLEKYINDQKSDLEYIDLSFKDKVFYKLKNNTKHDTMSTVSTSTASTTALDVIDN